MFPIFSALSTARKIAGLRPVSSKPRIGHLAKIQGSRSHESWGNPSKPAYVAGFRVKLTMPMASMLSGGKGGRPYGTMVDKATAHARCSGGACGPSSRTPPPHAHHPTHVWRRQWRARLTGGPDHVSAAGPGSATDLLAESGDDPP